MQNTQVLALIFCIVTVNASQIHLQKLYVQFQYFPCFQLLLFQMEDVHPKMLQEMELVIQVKNAWKKVGL